LHLSVIQIETIPS